MGNLNPEINNEFVRSLSSMLAEAIVKSPSFPEWVRYAVLCAEKTKDIADLLRRIGEVALKYTATEAMKEEDQKRCEERKEALEYLLLVEQGIENFMRVSKLMQTWRQEDEA